MGIYGPTPWFSIGIEQVGSVRLKKSLYGLKQAPRAWNSKITHGCVRWGFWPPSLTVHCSSGMFWKVQCNVDDMVITGPDLVAINKVKSHILEAFEMKDLGNLHYIFGIEVIHTSDDILLSQRHYVLNMLYNIGMTDSRPISTPLDKNQKLRPDSGEVYNETRFRQIVRSLIYLTITRSDLSYPVRLISHFMQRPTVKHLQCAQRILRYVSDIKDRRLLYRYELAEQLVDYTDADWAGDASDRVHVLYRKCACCME